MATATNSIADIRTGLFASLPYGANRLTRLALSHFNTDLNPDRMASLAEGITAVCLLFREEFQGWHGFMLAPYFIHALYLQLYPQDSENSPQEVVALSVSDFEYLSTWITKFRQMVKEESLGYDIDAQIEDLKLKLHSGYSYEFLIKKFDALNERIMNIKER